MPAQSGLNFLFVLSFMTGSFGNTRLFISCYNDEAMISSHTLSTLSSSQRFGYYSPIPNIHKRLQRTFVIDATIWHFSNAGVIM